MIDNLDLNVSICFDEKFILIVRTEGRETLGIRFSC